MKGKQIERMLLLETSKLQQLSLICQQNNLKQIAQIHLLSHSIYMREH